MTRYLLAWCRCQVATLQYHRGRLYAQKKAYKRAIATLNHAIPWHPRPAQIYAMQGFICWQMGDIDGALTHYNQAIALDPHHAKAYGNRGLILYQLGDEAGALADWHTALTHHPTCVEATYNRGLVHVTRKRYDAALADFNQALKANPNLVEAYYHRGIVRYQLGDRNGAIKDWQLAICNDLSCDYAKERLLSVRQECYNEDLTRRIQSALSPYNLTVNVHRTVNQLDLSIHRSRGVAINYRQLPTLVRDQLVPLQLYGIERFRIISRVEEVNFPDWDQTYRLYDGQPCPPSYWRAAILTTLLVFPPFGLSALMYAIQVKRLHRRGNYQAALRASNTVKGLCMMSGTMVCLMVLIVAGYAGFSRVRRLLNPPKRPVTYHLPLDIH